MADSTKPEPSRFVERQFSSLRTALDRLMADSQLRSGGFDERGIDVDVYEREGKTVVEASLPGYRLEEVDVQLHDGLLTIRAEHREEQEEQGRNYYRRERRVGTISRRIPLPGITSDTEVNAQFKDGVLRIEIGARRAASPTTAT